MRKPLFVMIVTLLVLRTVSAEAISGSQRAAGSFRWSQLPELPPAPDEDRQIGVAGPFVGTSQAVLIVAGGANFPAGVPWRLTPEGWNSPKIYHDTVFALIKQDGKYRWMAQTTKLPHPLAYGLSIQDDRGLICVGGEWQIHTKDEVRKRWVSEKNLSTTVFLLRWHADTEAVEVDSTLLPSLPAPLTNMAGGRVGDTIYVVGGDSGAGATGQVWSLNIASGSDSQAWAWERLADFPGAPRTHAVSAVQFDGTRDCLYVFGGRNRVGGRFKILTDAWKYGPSAEAWASLGDISLPGEPPRSIMAGAGIASGANHILVFGGDGGEGFVQREEILPRQIQEAQEAGDAEAAARLTAQRNKLFDNHQGFNADVLAYHTITNTWTKVGTIPDHPPVTTSAVRWDGGIVLPSGEIRPGVRSPQVMLARVTSQARFGLTNYLVLAVYLLALAFMGYVFSKNISNTDDFFKAGARIPWWAAGISIFGTQLSALTFMGIPAKTFATDWRYFIGNMSIVAAAPFVIFLFLPFYRRLNVTTAYEYLERRFNLGARLLGSIMFILFQFGRIGIVLYLPSIALSVVSGISIEVCICLMGGLCIFYTVLGGMEAVIWTDVIQVIVLSGGAILCLILIPCRIPGAWNGMMDIADQADKLNVLDFRFGLTDATFWVLLLGGLGANLISYGTDQAVIQRYLTTRNERAAAQSIWTNAVLTIPASLIFFGIGTALFAFYKTHPAALQPTLPQTDAIFPFFIVSQLPAGVAGLMIAALFAAAMSSLDSSMNSVSAAITTDFYRRLRAQAPERSCLLVARWTTLAIGLFGTAFALMMAQWDIKYLWDQFATFLGLFGGGLGGLFVLAIFSKRAHGMGALIGLAGSGIVQFSLQQIYPLHPWFYAVTGIVSCFVIGYLASALIPARPKPLQGLTIYTLADPD